MFKDADDVVQGPSVDAFKLRDGENYLSVTWCDYYAGTVPEQLRCAVEAIRNSAMKVGGKACFCVATTDQVKHASSTFGVIPAFRYYPEADNVAHAGVHELQHAEEALLQLLADEHWSEFLTKDEADALPCTECQRADGI